MSATGAERLWRLLFLLCAAGSAVLRPALEASVTDADGRDLQAVLREPVGHLEVSNQEARQVLEGIGSGYGIPILVEPEAVGKVSFDLYGGTVRTAIEAVCQPRGWTWGIDPEGFILVRRFVTRIYPIDYLQMTASGSSSASVNLSPSGSGTAAATGTTAAGQTAPAASGGQGSSAGTSTLSVSQQNEADFWGRLESDLRAMVGEGEGLVVNRFAGVVQVRGSLKTHAVLEAYLNRVMDRVGRQARISVKVVEVDLNAQSGQGIDWTAASSAIARLGSGSSVLSGSFSTATSSLSLQGPISFAPATFSGTLGVGGAQAAIQALSEQGKVTVESKPEIAALNNQTAFVQVSEDQPFFSRLNTTTFNAGGSAQVGNQPVVSTNYSESTVSFGNLLEITVQIADDLSTKLCLSPAMTELVGTVTSPDGQETAPITDTKRARTTVTVRNHETAVLGGFITETRTSDSRGVPGLASLPVVGKLFGTSEHGSSRSELVFLVTVNAERPSPIVPREVSRDGARQSAQDSSAREPGGGPVESLGL